MKDVNDLENKRSDGPGGRPAQQKQVKVKIRQGRAVQEGQPGAVVTVNEARAQYLVVIGFADLVVEE